MPKNLIEIKSRDNQHFKDAKKVRDGKNKNLIFVEGIRVCEEALRAKLKIRQCFFEFDFTRTERGRKLIEELSAKGVKFYQVSADGFINLSDTVASQGIILIADRPAADQKNFEEAFRKNNKLVVFLDQINNPSNLGAILRTAEAAGAAGMIISKNSADVFSQKSIRAAMGANFRLPLWVNADFYEALDWAKNNKLTTTAADIHSARKYTEIDWKILRMLIFGSEAHGLPVEKSEKIAEKIFIPMENQVESLNLAVSSGILLFEWKRICADFN